MFDRKQLKHLIFQKSRVPPCPSPVPGGEGLGGSWGASPRVIFFPLSQGSGSSWKPLPAKEEQLGEKPPEGSGRGMEGSAARNGDGCAGAGGVEVKVWGEKTDTREERCWCSAFW